MVNEVSAPSLARAKRPAAPISAAPAAGAKEVTGTTGNGSTVWQDQGKHTFSMNESTELPVAGSMKLKLVRTEPAKKLYDMRVIAGRRWYTHRRLKLNEPLWIAVDKQKAMEMVVGTIDNGTVSGYWTETSRPAQLSSRARAKHRRTE